VYARKRGISVSRLELGEEPDGQRVDPRDFGALYAQTARLIRTADPKAVMGGPSFVTLDADGRDDQTYRFDKRWWIRDFLRELNCRGEGNSFRFLSFEWYPFDDMQESDARQLPRSRAMLERTLRRYGSLGLPLVIGEYNYSVFPCRQEVDLSGGLLNAEIAAQFSAREGPSPTITGTNRTGWRTPADPGNQLMLLNTGASHTPVATFHALRLPPVRGWIRRVGVTACCRSPPRGRGFLEAWAIRRPDGASSLLLINKADHPVTVVVHGMKASVVSLYGSGQYLWQTDGPKGHPSRNLPPATSPCIGDAVTLPAFTLAVIR